jgi:hypothetical protein
MTLHAVTVIKRYAKACAPRVCRETSVDLEICELGSFGRYSMQSWADWFPDWPCLAALVDTEHRSQPIKVLGEIGTRNGRKVIGTRNAVLLDSCKRDSHDNVRHGA